MIAPAAETAAPAPTRHKPGDRIVRNVGFLSGSQAVTWVLALIYTLVVARALGPSGMGVLVVGWAIAGLAEGIAGLGSRPLLVKAIVRDPSQGPSLLGTAIVIRVVLLVPCAMGAYAYAKLGHFSDEQTLVILLGMGVALGFLTQEAIQGGLQAMERMEYLALTDVINKSLLTFVSIPIALAGLGPVWLMAVNVAAMAVGVAANLIWIRRFGIRWKIDLARIRGFVVDSLTYWAFALFYTIYLWIDSALLALLGTAQEVGWYGVSTRLFQTLMFLPVILSTAWLPRLAAAYKQDPQRLKAESETPLRLTGTLAMPIAVGTALIAGPLVILLYGQSFAAAEPVLAILAITAIPTYLNIVLSQVLIASDKQAQWTKILVVASVLNPVLNIVLIPIFHTRYGNGALGAAICMLVTELVVVILGAWTARAYLSASLGKRLLQAAVVTTFMGLAVALVGSLIPGHRLVIVAQVVVGILVFGVLARPARLIDGNELRELEPLLRRIPFWSKIRATVNAAG